MNRYYLTGFPPDKKPEIEKMLRNAGIAPFEEADNPSAVVFRSDKSRKELIIFAGY
jgi:hypothetical protein